MTVHSIKLYLTNLEMAGVFDMKGKRQEFLLKYIKDNVCLNQEDLQKGLISAGYKVTQSTISRDINQLNIIKGKDNSGIYRYIVDPKVTNENKLLKYHNSFAASVIKINYSLNNVVIKCATGMASPACVAVDELFGDKMIGSLAGDDTIIIVTKSEKHSAELCKELEKLI